MGPRQIGKPSFIYLADFSILSSPPTFMLDKTPIVLLMDILKPFLLHHESIEFKDSWILFCYFIY